jgi:hypothetical protein
MPTQALIDAVNHVLKIKKREGKTTKHDVALMVHGRIERLGGPTRFGIGAGALRMALMHLIEAAVTQAMKRPLSDHAVRYVLPADTPAEFLAALRKVPEWIAIGEGPDAEWVPSLQATPEHWKANAEMKRKKAWQTEIKADVSEEIWRFLMAHKFASLEECFTKGV